MPLFCDTALAARIERAEAALIAKAADASAAGFVKPIAGGVATFAGPDSPFNKVAGLGFGGVPSAAALDEVEAAFAARGAPVQIELAHLGVPSHEDFPRDVLERAERDFAAAGVARYVALLDGALAGGASFHIADGGAQLAGAATDPAHRRRGVHTALLAARLADAAAAGCDIAVVTTQPGSKSQENVQRHGFDLLYTRAIVVKPA